MAKTKELKEWHPIEFAGIWMLMDSPFYEGLDVLNADNIGEDNARRNAKLAAKAPELLKALRQITDHYWSKKLDKDKEFEMSENIMNLLNELK